MLSPEVYHRLILMSCRAIYVRSWFIKLRRSFKATSSFAPKCHLAFQRISKKAVAKIIHYKSKMSNTIHKCQRQTFFSAPTLTLQKYMHHPKHVVWAVSSYCGQCQIHRIRSLAWFPSWLLPYYHGRTTHPSSHLCDHADVHKCDMDLGKKSLTAGNGGTLKNIIGTKSGPIVPDNMIWNFFRVKILQKLSNGLIDIHLIFPPNYL